MFSNFEIKEKKEKVKKICYDILNSQNFFKYFF